VITCTGVSDEFDMTPRFSLNEKDRNVHKFDPDIVIRHDDYVCQPTY